MVANEVLIVVAVLLVVSVLLNKIGARFGVPSLIIFILVGIGAGSDGIGGIYFENYDLAQFIGVMAISYILFMGGLSVKFNEFKPIFVEGAVYAILGVLVTGVVLAGCCYLFLDFTALECLLLGSIVSSTDAAAVFSVLRSKSISLAGNLKPLLEFESGSNDPMAMFMTLGAIGLITGMLNPPMLILDFFKSMGLGLLFGYLIGRNTVFLINKSRLDSDSLYVVITLACVLVAYGFVDMIGGNGFISCYACGLTMSYYKFVNKKSLTRFHDSIAWLAQIIMFLILGLLINFKSAFAFTLPALGVALVLIFVARPVAIFTLSIFFKRSIREKLMVSWVGLRGAAAIVLAIFPLTTGIPHAEEIFNIIFFVVIISVLVQGTTIPYVAKWLKVDAPIEVDHSSIIEYDARNSNNHMFEFKIPADSAAIGKKLVELNLPQSSLVNLIYKDGEYIIPKGNTLIEAHDVMFVLVDTDHEDAVKNIFNAKANIVNAQDIADDVNTAANKS